MAKGNNIHDEIKEQRKKLKDLSFSDKIKYIWSYYWIPIVGVVLAVIFAVSLISSIVKNNYDTVCFVAVLDGKMTGYENDTDILTTGLTDYLGIDGKKEQVDFSYTFSLKEVAMDQKHMFQLISYILMHQQVLLTDTFLNVSILITSVLTRIYSSVICAIYSPMRN